MTPDLPSIVGNAWSAFGAPSRIVGAQETSPGVSTNHVFRIDLANGGHVFCKVSSYGSYVHFRQDHHRVLQWHHALRGSRFENLLACPLQRHGDVFTHRERAQWVVFYEQAPHAGVLPRVLPEFMIECLGEELAALHLASSHGPSPMHPTWATAGADLATLFDRMTSDEWTMERGYDSALQDLVAHHCERFFTEAERLGYHQMKKIPVLVDWNRGNFSVRHTECGPKLFSRWDYDWFRIEPRTFDLYFFARVVRAEGDQTAFSYTLEPLLEGRFVRFLRAYHAAFPLQEEELLFMREAYRFFLLNYVLLKGEHFFVPDLRRRLQRETLEHGLHQVDQADFVELARQVLAGG